MYMADNDDNVQTEQNQSTPPVEKEVDVTKIVSKRISEEREKIRKEALDEQAQSMGYVNHEEFVKVMTDDKISKTGLDPEEVKPLIKDLLKEDPEYKEALRYKKEKEELEKKMWAKQEIERLNKRFGTTISDVSDLAQEVVKLWNTGIPLEKAYAAENIDKITELATKRIQTGGKTIWCKVPGGGNPTQTTRIITEDDIRRMKRINPDKTEEQIRKFLEKNHNK